ncbi:MAG: DUF349 domain-containing protein [Burkholderiaceae bacterium]|nr:DUF349 domain-containing protein [Burkholderiaceae bacterium]
MPTKQASNAGTEAPIPEKESALREAQALNGGEHEAVEFILRCQFADARLIAAEHVRTQAMLEQVLSSVRNSDRRVAKLMQARLDALKFEQRDERLARQCLERALQLAGEPALLANLVVDLDHAWEAIAAMPDGVRSEFESAREQLRERLDAQTNLQRAVIATLAHLSELTNGAHALSALEARKKFELVEADMSQHLAHREAVLLPKHLLTEFAEQGARFQAMLPSLEEKQPDTEAREAQLADREAAPAKAILEEPSTATSNAERQDVSPTLEAMAAALQDGALRTAIDLDKSLHAAESRGLHLSKRQAADLTRLRVELGRMQGWAKWGGHISREELLKAAQELPAQVSSPVELAKRVGGLREHWKALDAQSGPARKDLWERFDAACTLAYAPAATHFKKLSEERRNNVGKAEALIAEVRQYAVAHGPALQDAGSADWKALAVFCAQSKQTWQRLGAIDRKDKKRLDKEFTASLSLLEKPLAERRQTEVAQRENLIARVAALQASDRNALDTLHSLQEQWQQSARLAPLERKVEQALWKKFRVACDALFAKRKEAAAGADAERKRHLAEKEELCRRLEVALAELPPPALGKLLRETRDAWGKIGAVPRAVEKKIEARLHAAANAVQKQLGAARQAALDAECTALLNKIKLCRTLEQGWVDGASALPDLAQWQAMPAIKGEYERVLKARYDSGLRAVQANDANYRVLLQKNRETHQQMLLRAEIVAGIESPAELSRERLQLQVQVLQSTLKNGAHAGDAALLLDLCKLPALTDAATAARVDRVIGKLLQK